MVGDDGVRIPLDSPMNLGLSSQLEALWPPGGVIVGLSKVLSEMIVCGNGFSEPFSVIMIGFMRVGGAVCWTGSILGGGTPVSRPKGTSSRFALADLALIGGPASRGVRNTFSHDPGRGSLELVVATAGVVATGGV